MIKRSDCKNSPNPKPLKQNLRFSLQADYDDLQARYLDLQSKVIRLNRQNHEIIIENTKHLLRETENRIFFIERVKTSLIVFNIKSLFFDPDVHTINMKLILQQNYVSPPLTYLELDNLLKSPRAPEIFKKHVRSTFLERATTFSFLTRLLRVTLRNFNNKLFNIQLKVFHNAVLNYILRNEEHSQLVESPNFYILKEIKQNIEEQVDIILPTMNTGQLGAIFESHYSDIPIEMKQIKSKSVESSLDDNFSLRSVRSHLELFESELMTLSTYILDDL